MMAWTTRETRDQLYAWSARPDLWGPGVWVRTGYAHAGQMFANWAADPWDAKLEIVRWTASRVADPGVAEAAILTGGLRVMCSGITGHRWSTWPAGRRI